MIGEHNRAMFEVRRQIVRQGGRYLQARLRYLQVLCCGPTQPCPVRGCHGTEGVCPRELNQSFQIMSVADAPFMSRIDRLHPGDFPCSYCGSTGLVPTKEER
jgi:hypothetical protein